MEKKYSIVNLIAAFSKFSCIKEIEVNNFHQTLCQLKNEGNHNILLDGYTFNEENKSEEVENELTTFIDKGNAICSTYGDKIYVYFTLPEDEKRELLKEIPNELKTTVLHLIDNYRRINSDKERNKQLQK